MVLLRLVRRATYLAERPAIARIGLMRAAEDRLNNVGDVGVQDRRADAAGNYGGVLVCKPLATAGPLLRGLPPRTESLVQSGVGASSRLRGPAGGGPLRDIRELINTLVEGRFDRRNYRPQGVASLRKASTLLGPRMRRASHVASGNPTAKTSLTHGA
jgi:hypothetical protein